MASWFFKPWFKREIVWSRPFYFELKTGEGYYLMNGRITNRPLWIKVSRKYWQWKICTRNPTRCWVGSVWGNTCFYPCGYYGECGWVSCAKAFRERRDQWNGFGRLTGVATKILGPQQKYLCQCQIFCGLSIKKNTMGRLSGIYARSPDCIE